MKGSKLYKTKTDGHNYLLQGTLSIEYNSRGSAFQIFYESFSQQHTLRVTYYIQIKQVKERYTFRSCWENCIKFQMILKYFSHYNHFACWKLQLRMKEI